MEVSYSCFGGNQKNEIVVGAVEKLEISPPLRDFQAEWESPSPGLFRGAGFSTALLPTNTAIDPFFWMVRMELAVNATAVDIRRG